MPVLFLSQHTHDKKTYPGFLLLFFGLAMVIVTTVWATPSENTPASETDSPRFFLVTIGPGKAYWSAWGHTELLVQQPGQEGIIYSYGYFDFADEDFFSNFLTGRMRYFLDHEPAARELNRFAAEGRDIWLQPLDIPAEKSWQLLQALQQQDTDANRYYDYDYFQANCTSRIRDLINQAVSRPLQPWLSRQPGPSWAELTLPVDNQGWLNLALSLAYGQPAWEKRNRWENAVFPLRLKNTLEQLPVALRPVENSQQVFQGRPATVSFWATHGPLAGISLLFLLAMLWPRSRFWGIKIWLIVQTLTGWVLLGLWLLTNHYIAAKNPNILLMWPWALALLKCQGQHKRYCDKWLMLSLAATGLWLLWAFNAGALYLLPFALLDLLLVFLLFRAKNHN